MAQLDQDRVPFEVVVPSETGRSMFAPDEILTPENVDQFAPPAGRAQLAGLALQSLGFDVDHVGTFSISGNVERGRWEEAFQTRVGLQSRRFSPAHPELGELSYLSHMPGVPFTVPERLQGLVERAYPQLPPTFFESPLPPPVGFHYLRVPDDVGLLLRAAPVHALGVTGRGVLVAMPDTGFYQHPFYAWHGYNYNATLAPDAIRVDHDEVGHGTAEAANIFAGAPEIDFVGVKMGANATLAFKAASDLFPAVMTNSWGYDLSGLTTLPNFLKALEAAVIEAVRIRGITVCFSAGNGQVGFPGMMPDVISAGGVYVDANLQLQASDYASSFDSLIYPGRHVPDFCGLVGLPPKAAYIMLPVEPGDAIDVSLAASPYPNGDNTLPDDGWTVISGTSAASPQVAGICALLKQVQPGLSPGLIKSILRASARDVTLGVSAMGEPAGEGFDGATVLAWWMPWQHTGLRAR